jgi:hypothetical protein
MFRGIKVMLSGSELCILCIITVQFHFISVIAFNLKANYSSLHKATEILSRFQCWVDDVKSNGGC